ncbi:MAG: hypothetical protein MOB07_14395 [Acidobacteria bacterium]|nr:hypothetical protein [Acidobacteriota bacterium]
MKTLKHFIAILLCISLCAPLTQAQPAQDKQQDAQANNPIAQDVLIIIQQEKVRFTAQKAVAEMQLQIFDQTGELIYDSGAVTEAELSWSLQGGSGETVKSGVYAYTLSVKAAGAETARVRRGHFIVDRARERDNQTDRLWITSQSDSGVGTELTVARNEGVMVAGTRAIAGERSGVKERASEIERADGKELAGKDQEQKTANGQNSLAAAAITGTGLAGRLAKFTSATEIGNSEIFEQNGKLGIGITSPVSKLHIVSGASLQLPPRLQSSGTNTFGAGWDFYHGTTGVGYVGVPDGGVGIAPGEMLVYGVGSTSLWAGRQRSVTIAPNGNVGIGTTTPGFKLEVVSGDTGIVGKSSYGAGVYGESNGFNGVRGIGRAAAHGAVVGVHEAGGIAVYGLSSGTGVFGDSSSGGGFGGYFRNTAGGVALRVEGMAQMGVLQITGGADFAENFDVSVAPESSEAMKKVEAGLVVSIDPTNPGKLQLSRQAYDRRVAGIISGAGGVKPGMMMSQEGTLADGQHPVALSGRVYCWVDASQGAIDPGDLLTTASTPGHAMKAVDAVKAQGAIIGKAMTGLKEGKGLVLVLVTLQ